MSTNASLTLPIQGTPYLPGCAQGHVQQRIDADAPDCILLLRQTDLPYLGPRPAGVIAVGGAPFSHPMLRLRTLGVPIVLIEPEQADALKIDDVVGVDGHRGLIGTPDQVPCLPAPDIQTRPYTTTDGTTIELHASISNAHGAAMAVAHGANGIGNARSEFLLPPDGRAPDAEFFQVALEVICQAAQGLPINVRLVDIAGDKRPPWLPDLPGIATTLGLQGCRLYDIEPVRTVLHAELDALHHLAGRYPLRVLIPYLTQLEELERWREIIQVKVDDTFAVGAMLETPAAALAVSSWLQTADFVALGCNDLMQCLFATDRDHPDLYRLLDPYCPTLYRFLHQVVREAGPDPQRILVCGLLSQLPGVLTVLIGLGYRRFSVDPAMIPWLADMIRKTNLNTAAQLAEQVCRARHSDESRQLLLATKPN